MSMDPLELKPPRQQSNMPILLALCGMSAIAVLAIVVITALRPAQDNTALITSVITIIMPTTAALLAYMKGTETQSDVHDVHIALNGHLTELVNATGRAAHAEGMAEGVAQTVAAQDAAPTVIKVV